MLKNVISMTGPVAHSHLTLSPLLAPSISPREFKDAMTKLAFSISIVTARHGDEQLGRTVTSLMPLSAAPPHIMVSIDVRSRLIDLIGLSRNFSVSFLSVGQQAVGDTFAAKGSQEDRFPVSDWDYWPSGNPKLANASVAVDCELVGSIDAGEHILFIGAITESAICQEHPLLWTDRAYHIPAAHVPPE